MNVSAVGRRYAKAILELGSESGQLDALVAEIASLATTYAGSPELQDVMDSPLLAHAQKKAVMGEVADTLGVGPIAKNTVLLLNDRRRMRNLPEIAQALRDMSDEKKGLVHAEVISAKPLSDDYCQKLKAQLERATGKRIALDRTVDESLIAGVIARIGDTVYDGSLKARLSELRTHLLSN